MAYNKGVKPQTGADRLTSIDLHMNRNSIPINKSQRVGSPTFIERQIYKCHERRSLCRPVTFLFH